MPPPRPPLLTVALLFVLLAYFLVLKSHHIIDPFVMRRLLLTGRIELIWQGQYWALLTHALAHERFLHLLFNAIWIWAFGRLLESLFGVQVLFGLIFFGALAGSCADVAIGFWPALGATSIVYTLFGVLLACRRDSPIIAAALPRATIALLLGWLPLLWVLTIVQHWRAGFLGPVAGLALGWLAARALLIPRRRLLAMVTLATLALTLGAAALRPEWLPQWQIWRSLGEVAAGDVHAAWRRLDRLAQSDNPNLLNTLAWVMATAPNPQLRNGNRAIELAQRANEAQDFKNPVYLDTLAAAHAEVGHWTDAINLQKKAIEMIRFGQLPLGVDPADLERLLRANLATITEHRPVRDTEFSDGLHFEIPAPPASVILQQP